MINFATDMVEVSLLGNNIRLESLINKISKTYFVKRYRDALSVSTPKGQVFVFDYGVVLFWGLSESKKAQLTEVISEHVIKANPQKDSDSFHFKLSESGNLALVDDCIYLSDHTTMTLLAVSHGLAQSAKLGRFEVLAERTIKDNAYLSTTLASTGKIPLSRKKLSMLRGALFSTKSDILLHFNLLDTPEFFWEYPEEEHKYLAVSKYLDLKPRVELLTMKLATINELHEMLAAEQNHKHSSFLEWIIIILIAVEIVLFFVH
ncbi:RMD1 family protein [Paraglaciecola sp. 2405UD69-4]|uniref:RMD1 family protein n=1 Tax=Paraglaciecola sp. 2405UD69-4 TaxID=3391836 RepID=UPI0039C9CA72